MQTKDRITIEVPAGPSKVLNLVSKASGVSKSKLVSSMFAIMAMETLKIEASKTHGPTAQKKTPNKKPAA